MATHSQAVQDALKREIRDARALDPLISTEGLVETLNKRFNRSFDWRYVKKLAEKVERHMLVEIDRAKIDERLAFTRENYRMMRTELMKIVYWAAENAPEGTRPPRAQDRIEAAKNVVMMDLALLQAEVLNGIYKRPVEEIAKTFAYEPVPGEIRTVIIASWARGGLLPAATVHEMVPLQEHEQTN